MKLLNIEFELYYQFQFDEDFHICSNEDGSEQWIEEPGWYIIVQVYNLNSFIKNKSFLVSENNPHLRTIRNEQIKLIIDVEKQLELLREKNLNQFEKIQKYKNDFLNHSNIYKHTDYIKKILAFLEEIEIIFRRWFKIHSIDPFQILNIKKDGQKCSKKPVTQSKRIYELAVEMNLKKNETVPNDKLEEILEILINENLATSKTSTKSVRRILAKNDYSKFQRPKKDY